MCKACNLAIPRTADFNCIDCCMRYFSGTPAEQIEPLLKTIGYVTSPEHAEYVRAAWSEFVVNRGK